MNGPACSLDEVDWQSLRHAYGPAGDIPGRIRELRSGDRRVRLEAYEYLADALGHQQSQYEATSVAIRFVIPLVADPAAPDRSRACFLLTSLAIGSELPWLREPANLAHLRRDVERRSAMTVAELRIELEDWVADAPTTSVRRWRALQADWLDVEERQLGDLYALRSYDAAQRGVAGYVKALRSSDPALRLAATYLLGWFPEESATSLPHLKRLLAAETETSLVATAAIAAALVAPQSDPDLAATLTPMLSGPHPAERWAAAIGLARLSALVDPPVVEILYDCVRRASRFPTPVPYLEGDLSALAVLTLPLLSDRAAPDRLEVLTDHLMRLPVQDAPDARLVGDAIVRIAFPSAPAKFADLSEAQRKALTALCTSEASHNSVWWRDLAGEYGLPTDISFLGGYAGP